MLPLLRLSLFYPALISNVAAAATAVVVVIVDLLLGC